MNDYILETNMPAASVLKSLQQAQGFPPNSLLCFSEILQYPPKSLSPPPPLPPPHFRLLEWILVVCIQKNLNKHSSYGTNPLKYGTNQEYFSESTNKYRIPSEDMSLMVKKRVICLDRKVR